MSARAVTSIPAKGKQILGHGDRVSHSWLMAAAASRESHSVWSRNDPDVHTESKQTLDPQFKVPYNTFVPQRTPVLEGFAELH